ncbi:MAG: hypothetical protein IJ083_07585 [Clostridia bacterium]|nr:hypothetical protein [Clostridia bacterium]
MKLVLCPRCELNYMAETDKYCKVCMQEMYGMGQKDEVELCSICNENPVIPGKDVCLMCLKEMNNQTGRTDTDLENDRGTDALDDMEGMDSVTSMDEIIPDMEDERQGFGDGADGDLSYESVRESEEEEEDDDLTDDGTGRE